MTAISGFIEQPLSLLMIAIALLLLYLGIIKRFEPLLLVPISFGVLLANIPYGNMGVVSEEVISSSGLLDIAKEHGIMNMLYYALIKTGLLPPIIFMGVGALTDFGPMLRNLRLAYFGGAAQIGIFTVLIFSVIFGMDIKEAAAIGIIGGADGPTAIYTAIKLAPHLLGPIAIAAYSYMALVPVIIPMVVKFTMTEKEIRINMKEQDRLFPPRHQIKDIKKLKIIFPIVLCLIVSVLVPSATPLIGMLLFGNLVKEIGTDTHRLYSAASESIMNAATIFLGLTIGATMKADTFLTPQTLLIVLGGFLAFVISVAGGIYAAKIYNRFSNKKINPLIGATGLSAVPMSSRVANEIALKYDSENHILQYAMSSNISGVIGSAVAAGVLISFLS
ncbi:MAG: sodium ion-translocating decarboxylase subunit beta [Saprospiraceae bacterium]|nr:sodium ion-translocating decarboxylase subunit beta [Saprospiraceae bacterium]MBK6565342.1 sodium ion-translocating decarboxylase subunit beta [Saprospiraceae bacterium]MBK6784178.1 sodium ion-translocating decarboxylase subunit beta [Saprospiraceae bacterium]MBK7522622.1 sodium ion-translocating decarboxylase subunit beta [Saprospiraceae bacterium]MBK8371163.1 sodium ion-translocating decarboxylase subunit beta [Saprospiraceae bacterium]